MSNEELKTNKVPKKEQRRVNILIGTLKCVVLTGIALAFQFLEFNISGMPKHITFTFTLVPELIAALAFGPIAGAGVVGGKLIFYFLITGCTKITLVDNFIIEGGFVIIVGLVYSLQQLIYNRKYDRARNEKIIFKQRMIALLIGVIATPIITYVCRLYITYPFMIEKMGVLEKVIIQTYNIRSVKTDLSSCIVSYDCMAMLLKNASLGVISLIVYRLVSPFMKQINI